MSDTQSDNVREDGPTWRGGSGAALVALAAVLVAITGVLSLAGRPATAPAGTHIDQQGTRLMPKVNKTEAEWRAQLTPEQYHVTREKGTERPYTGEFWNHKEPGKYRCVGCGAELFTSESKYDSHCGWPSFHTADNPEGIHEEVDRTHGMIRTEVICKNCGAHLGHLFDDGPQPTGMRYCINSASLKFEKADEKK